MSFAKISQRSAVVLCVISLMFIVSCGKKDSKKTDRKDSQSECPDCEKRHAHAEADGNAKKDNLDKTETPETAEKDAIYAETISSYI